MTIIPVVIEQHAEEAAFLWLLRDSAVYAPHYVLWELARLDNRVEAHLDGLRIASDAGWELIAAQLDERQEPGEVFVAAYFAFESNRPERINKVLDIAAPVPALRRGVISALGWLSPATAQQRLAPLLSSTVVGVHHIALGGSVAHRLSPGTALERALAHLDPSLRARALQAAGVMGYPAWNAFLKKELRSNDLSCRFAAAWSLARLTGDAAALAELQTIALVESRRRLAAINMIMRRLDIAAARKVIRTLERVPGSERTAVFAAGALGDPAEVPFLLDQMAKPELARLAGEAFSWITGEDLALSNLETDAPEGFEAGPNEDALDEHIDLDPDERLPWPHVSKLKDWWSRNRSRYPESTRHLAGQPITPDSLKGVLAAGNQRQRAAAALELGLRNPTHPLFETRAPGFRQ
jgi:uncharacterized protein (TIGR02270 family)